MKSTVNQNKKPGKKSKSLIATIVIICLMFAGGLGLMLYPFITNIPSLFQKGDQISRWESEKQNNVAKEEKTASEDMVTDSTLISDSNETSAG